MAGSPISANVHDVDADGDVTTFSAQSITVNQFHGVSGPVVGVGRVWCVQVPLPPAVEVRTDGLEMLLADAGDRVVVRPIVGCGGVGKTTAAASYARSRFDSRQVDVVWWVRSEDSQTMLEDLVEMGANVGASTVEGDLEGSARRALQALANLDKSWLVVFDNAPSPQSLTGWVPTGGNGQVVVTSRHQVWDSWGRTVPIGVWTLDTTVDFLLARVPGAMAADQAVLRQVAAKAAGLALAAEQIAAYMSQKGRRWDSYLDLFTSGDPFPAKTCPSDYPETAFATWRISITAANDEASGADRLLSVIGYLSPDGIPPELLAGIPGLGDEFLPLTGDEVDAAILALAAYSIVEIGTRQQITVHRVVQDAARRNAPDGTTEFVGALLAALFPDPGDPANSEQCAALVAHVVAFSEHTGTAQHGWAGVYAMTKAGQYLRSWANHQPAIELHEHALRAVERRSHPEPADLVPARGNLAISYWSAGKITEATTLFEEVVADSERVFGADHPGTLKMRSNLANSYQSAGRTDEAIALKEQVLADRERILGTDHPGTLNTRNNLANSYQAAGRTSEAIALTEQVLADRERILGTDHPDTVTTRHNLTYSYQAAGRTSEAIALEERVLADRERILGADHPDTTSTRQNLAYYYRVAGRNGDAIALEERVLADRERILGTDHPDTLTTRDDLATSYLVAGRISDAIALEERVLADRERILGTDHPDTIGTRQNLASFHQSASPRPRRRRIRRWLPRRS